MIKENEKLSLYGISSLFAWSVIIVTIIFRVTKISFGRVEQFRIVFLFVGICLILEAVLLYANAVFKAKIEEHIRKDKLVTTGAYAYVRNPIYSSVLILCTGIILLSRNWCLLCLPVLYWFYLTKLLKCTEEIWLAEFYGKQYLDYCKKTNRCIPWIPR